MKLGATPALLPFGYGLHHPATSRIVPCCRHDRRAGYRCSGTCPDRLLAALVVRICAQEVRCSRKRGNVRSQLLLVLKDVSVHRYLPWYERARSVSVSDPREMTGGGTVRVPI